MGSKTLYIMVHINNDENTKKNYGLNSGSLDDII